MKIVHTLLAFALLASCRPTNTTSKEKSCRVVRVKTAEPSNQIFPERQHDIVETDCKAVFAASRGSYSVGDSVTIEIITVNK